MPSLHQPLRLAALALTLAAPTLLAQTTVAPSARYAPVVAELERFIQHEMTDKHLPALSIALVDDQQIVWARGFGYARLTDSTPATAETIYRVGSVSKLFTDIGIMQLAEQGRVDLDAPLSRYLPELTPAGPFGTAITLRQLMSHRAGLVREPPIGNYFDSTGPTLAATVASLSRTTLIYAPGTHTKYSNAGVAVVGEVLERIRGEPFAHTLQRTVLEPLGMRRSGFEPPATPALQHDLATGFMWTMDGRSFAAPTFPLGVAPAGSMYTTVSDLGRFVSALFAGGRGGGGRILQPRTLQQMWTPQYPSAEDQPQFGIGFSLSRLEGRRSVGHGGAIYGFSTELAALPDDKLGVVVALTIDATNAVASRIADAALARMLAVKRGQPVAPIPMTRPAGDSTVRALAGHYGRDGTSIDLVERGGQLALRSSSGRLLPIRARAGTTDDSLVVDSRLAFGPALAATPSGIVFGADSLERAASPRPAPPPGRWAGLIGEYGWDYDVLYIEERAGTLYANIEWFFPYPLRELGTTRDTFAFPDEGLYDHERLVFRRDSTGRATQAVVGGVVFPRRSVGPAEGNQLVLKPVRPIAELRTEALAARPPEEHGHFRQPDLVDVARLDPSIKLEIRYATSHNLFGTPFYAEPRAFLERPAAVALIRAHRLLAASGYGILIHDTYRPWYVTKMFWDATPPDKKIFVADPADGSRHNRGAAADVTLYQLATGRPVEMVSTYDETSDRAFPDYPGGTSLQRWHRDLLRSAMEAQGFSVYDAEWWHFDYKDWREYPIINLRFEQVDSVNAAAPRDSASAIDRVTRALRPPVEVVGRPPVRWTLADRMAHYHVPGVGIALIDSGRIAWARGFGVKEAGTTDSIGGATIFQAGSTSKPIAVTAMLRLVEQGKLSLDENVNRYLRSWKLPENRFTAREKVTLRRIVSHSAGLTVHGFPGYAVGEPLPTLPQILDGKKPANTEAVRVDTFPGALYRYSGGGLTIMQQLLIDVTGKSFPELTRDLVLGPTGMTHSTYQEPLPSARLADAARAHDSQGVMIPGGWHIYPEMAAAGLWTTPGDLARWALAITAARAGRASAPLSPATVTQMLTVQKEPLGLGVFLGGNGRAFHFGHGGDNEGFHADLVMYPEAGQGVAVMTNGDAGPALIQEIINAVSDEYQWPERRLTRVTPAALDSSEIASVVGDYTIKASEPVQVRVRRGGAQLVLDVSPYFPPAELVPESPTSFVAVELGWHLRAVRAGAGPVSALAIELDPTDTVSATRSDSASADR